MVAKKRGTDGSQTVVVHENSPWQRFDKVGTFQTGMMGFPLHVFSTRSRVNSAFPKSDCAVLKDVADEKIMGRSQMVMQRKRNMPLRGINIHSPSLTRDTVEQIESGEYQSLIKFSGPVSQTDLYALPMAHFPSENFSFDSITQQDIDRLAASGANQQGLPIENSDTAYEASLIQRATENRQAKERARLLTQYARGCKKLFSLIQLFASDEELIEVIGKDGQGRFAAWDRMTIQGDFAFRFNPDSSLRIDAATNREMTLRFANIVSNNQNFNQQEVAGMICDAFGHDRKPLLQQPPQPKPEPPRATFSIRGEDLDPRSPQYEGVRLYLQTFYGMQRRRRKRSIPSARGHRAGDETRSAQHRETAGPRTDVMAHEFRCETCGAPSSCARWDCRTLPHRCPACQIVAARTRPSGDVISEKPWPTRPGAAREA
jgi:hypothetical protein